MNRLLLVLILLLLIVPVAGAQEATTLTPELEAQLATLEEATHNIRNLEGLEALNRDFPTRDEVIAYLDTLLTEELSAEDEARFMSFYAALGLLPAGTDLRGIYLDLLGSQVAGFYDTETQVMNIIPIGGGEVGDEIGVMEQVIYVHEYVHALQDQHFDLDALIADEALMNEPDRSLALTSLVEGDATLVMQVFTEELVSQNPLLALQLLGEGAAAGAFNMPDGTPPILLRELTYPYEGGLAFVMDVRDAGGWEAVNAAFANPPVSSEQVIHPEKYLTGELPVAVTLGDGEALLGADWVREWDTTLGEWYLVEHLRTQVDRNDALRGAAGWGGDRMHIYRDTATDGSAMALKLVWDTPADADEFATTYADFGATRYESVAEDGCWSGSDDALCLLANPDGTLITYAPTVEQARALLAVGE